MADELVERLLERWEKMPRAAAYKIQRILVERKDAAARIQSDAAEIASLKAELEAFKQKVSEAIQNYKADCDYKAYMALDRFIIPKPDPLVEVLQVWGEAEYGPVEAGAFRAVLATRGLEIREIDQ